MPSRTLIRKPLAHPAPGADPLDALLSRLANGPDPLVAHWADALLTGDKATSDNTTHVRESLIATPDVE